MVTAPGWGLQFLSHHSSRFRIPTSLIKRGKLMRMGFVKASKSVCVPSVAKSETRSRVQLERDRLTLIDALVG